MTKDEAWEVVYCLRDLDEAREVVRSYPTAATHLGFRLCQERLASALACEPLPLAVGGSIDVKATLAEVPCSRCGELGHRSSKDEGKNEAAGANCRRAVGIKIP